MNAWRDILFSWSVAWVVVGGTLVTAATLVLLFGDQPAHDRAIPVSWAGAIMCAVGALLALAYLCIRAGAARSGKPSPGDATPQGKRVGPADQVQRPRPDQDGTGDA